MLFSGTAVCDACRAGALGASFDDDDFEHAPASNAATMTRDVLRTIVSGNWFAPRCPTFCRTRGLA
jgi:hypothetical protein